MSPIDDNALTISTTEVFDAWLINLHDGLATAQIAKRIERLRRGHWGYAKSVGDGVMEMRLHTGPGYRLYAVQRQRLDRAAMRRRQVEPEAGYRTGQADRDGDEG